MAKGGGGGGGEAAQPQRCRACDRLARLLRGAHKKAEKLAREGLRLRTAALLLRREMSRREEYHQVTVQQMQQEEERRERILKADAAKRVVEEEREARRYQELYELTEKDLEVFRTRVTTLAAENAELKAKLKEVESLPELSETNVDHQHTAKHSRAEIRKLKEAYKALSNMKEKEVSALRAENKFVWNQFNTMEKEYRDICKKKDIETRQATEGTQMLRQEVDELKAEARKKNDEIDRLQAELSRAKEKILVLEDERQQMCSLIKSKDDENGTVKQGRPKTSGRCKKDITEKHRKSRSEGSILREKSSNSQVTPLNRKVKTPRTRVSSRKEMQSGSRKNSHTLGSEEKENFETSLKRKRGSLLSHHAGAVCLAVDIHREIGNTTWS
ncbi:hypothetical protein ACP4OV_010254 [Aristida adscensionis]